MNAVWHFVKPGTVYFDFIHIYYLHDIVYCCLFLRILVHIEIYIIHKINTIKFFLYDNVSF